MECVFEKKLEIKYSVISEICRAKHILFAETSEHITKRDKMNKWQEIFEHSMDIGGAGATRSWSYLRDVYWPNVKRSTMTKVNRQGLLNQIDLTVLKILNLKNNGQKYGQKLKVEIKKLEQKLKVRESRSKRSFDESISVDDVNLLPIKQESVSLPTSPVPSSAQHDDDDQNDFLYQINDGPLFPNNLVSPSTLELDMPNQYNEPDDGFKKIKLTLNPSPPSPSPSSSSRTPPTNMKDDISILRKRKLEEQVEFLKLQNVKARLEIKEAEIRVLILEKDLELKKAQVAETLK